MTAAVARVARQGALTVGAVLGTLCLVWTLGSAFLGITPLVFMSGSMHPTIETGDLALARSVPAADLKVGEVVSVATSSGERITHRIVEIDPDGNRAILTLRGDANEVVDPEPYTVTQADRVFWHADGLGFVVDALASPWALVLTGAFVAVLLLTGLRRGRDDADVRGRHRGVAVVALAMASVVTVGSGAGWPSQVAPTAAAFTKAKPDLVKATFAGHVVTKPTVASCNISGLLVYTATITWAATTTPYPLEYRAVITETGRSLPVEVVGTTRRVQVSDGLLGTILGSTATVSITAVLPAANGAWRSVPATQKLHLGLLGAGLSCGTAS